MAERSQRLASCRLSIDLMEAIVATFPGRALPEKLQKSNQNDPFKESSRELSRLNWKPILD